MKTKKINAFTLTEVMVVLVISSIVISLAFMILSLVQKQMESIHKNINFRSETMFFERVLWHDFNSYSMSYDVKNDVLLGKRALDSISYVFYDEYLIRNSDTIFVPIQNKLFYIDGAEVVEGGIDAVKFTTSKKVIERDVFIFKDKAADSYIN